MKARDGLPVTIATWASVLVVGTVTAAALVLFLGVVLPFLVIDPPYGFGIHPLLEHNPGPSSQNDGTYGRILAGLLAWLGGTYAGIRAANLHGRGERLKARVGLAVIVVILIVADALVTSFVRAKEAEPPPKRSEPTVVSQRTPLRACGDDKLQPNGDPSVVENHQCLLDAFVAGDTAEFVLFDFPDGGELREQIVRAVADGTVEVFVHTGADYVATAGWQRFTCAALRSASAPRVFELVDCTEPVGVE